MPGMNSFASVEAAWDFLYGPDGDGPAATQWFHKAFPKGHETSIRPLAEELLARFKAGKEIEVEKGKCAFHPGALEILLVHGIDYIPYTDKLLMMHGMRRKPRIGQCFGNSWQFMEAINAGEKSDKRLVYVEGMAVGYMANTMLHAWNSFGLSDKRASDWSMYPACPWTRYFGVPFTEAEHEELRSSVWPNHRRAVSLFDLKSFPFFAERILEILAKREQPVSP